MARSRRTSALLVSRCSSELSGHKLQRKLKSHRLRGKPTSPGEPWGGQWRDLQSRGFPVEMLFERAYPDFLPGRTRDIHVCAFP
jgi:hypothetical protein